LSAACPLRPLTWTPPRAPVIVSGDAYVPRSRPRALRSVTAPLNPRVTT
jgi:hypothetical protein